VKGAIILSESIWWSHSWGLRNLSMLQCSKNILKRNARYENNWEANTIKTEYEIYTVELEKKSCEFGKTHLIVSDPGQDLIRQWLWHTGEGFPKSSLSLKLDFRICHPLFFP
jgi:hypothetical protein